MGRFLIRLIINTIALWLTTIIVEGVKVVSYGAEGDTVALVLTYLLGYPNVRNYDGSWTEYGNLVNVPIEK